MRSLVTTIGWDGSDPQVVLDTSHLVEAPNWSPDGRWLIVNVTGSLARVAAQGGSDLESIDGADGLPPVNNDHVLSPDGTTVYASANDGHIYAVSLGCRGAVRRVTNDHRGEGRRFHFLHGVSPDGVTLAYVLLVRTEVWLHHGIWTVPAAGGEDTQVLSGAPPKDGPEWSPDGRWLYFNGDVAEERPGHSQIYRRRTADGAIEQVTDDDRVNWFPHLSPDGRHLLHLSYPPGTQGHPADREVLLRRSEPDGTLMEDVTALRGGQGTINVNSWAPDSSRFAYISYVQADRP